MKKFLKFSVVLTVLLAFCAVFFACPSPTSSDDGDDDENDLSEKAKANKELYNEYFVGKWDVKTPTGTAKEIPFNEKNFDLLIYYGIRDAITGSHSPNLKMKDIDFENVFDDISGAAWVKSSYNGKEVGFLWAYYNSGFGLEYINYLIKIVDKNNFILKPYSLKLEDGFNNYGETESYYVYEIQDQNTLYFKRTGTSETENDDPNNVDPTNLIGNTYTITDTVEGQGTYNHKLTFNGSGSSGTYSFDADSGKAGSADKTGNWSISGNEITLSYALDQVSGSEVFTISEDSTQIILTEKSGGVLIRTFWGLTPSDKIYLTK